MVDDDEEEDDEADNVELSDSESSEKVPLTKEAIEEKLAELKENKKSARKEKLELDAKVKAVAREIKSLEKKRCDIEASMRAICIQGRNNYSKGAIQ